MRTQARAPTRWLLAPAAAGIFVGGVWVAGGVITDQFKLAMALTGAWFVVSAAAVFAIGRRRRPLAAPLASGFLIAAIAVGGYLAATTLRDKVVHETVVRAATSGNTLVAAGSFRSIEHGSSGRATVVRQPDGRQVLTLTEFDTSPGPDLRVRLVPGDTSDGGADGNIDLGGLKGNRGNQQYELPSGLDPARHSVVVWCRAFSVAFAAARLA
jgi:Electron transfer DM13